MTLYSLAAKDLKKARLNLAHALLKPNVSASEIMALEKLVTLRMEIFNLVGGATHESDFADKNPQ